MAKTKDSREQCSRYAHTWDSGLCTICFEEHPAAQRQRVWNAMMARIVGADARVYDVPPPPDYSTPQACTDRALERGTRSPWYLDFVRISRQNGRTYRDFRRAVERAGGTLALPFPAATLARHARKAVAA
jgi:hypothetical protein